MRIRDWSSDVCSSDLPSGNSSSGGIDIRVMSNRADLISGGDALLDIVTPAGVDSASVTMSLNGKDVSGAFASTEDGTLRGLVTGLDVGDNTFKVQYPGGRAQTTLVDHPNGGPILSGPQLQPWTCQDGAVDAQRSEEHTSELQSLMRISYAVFCLKKKKTNNNQ